MIVLSATMSCRRCRLTMQCENVLERGMPSRTLNPLSLGNSSSIMTFVEVILLRCGGVAYILIVVVKAFIYHRFDSFLSSSSLSLFFSVKK